MNKITFWTKENSNLLLTNWGSDILNRQPIEEDYYPGITKARQKFLELEESYTVVDNINNFTTFTVFDNLNSAQTYLDTVSNGSIFHKKDKKYKD